MTPECSCGLPYLLICSRCDAGNVGLATELKARADAAEAENRCDVCDGRPLESGRECMCGGTGKKSAAVQYLRERVVTLEAALEAVSAAIGSVRWMDPPDGGSVTLAEQVKRMRDDLHEAEAQSEAAYHQKIALEKAVKERDAEIERLKSDDAERLRVLQEVTGSNNTENPWLGVAASVTLLQMQIKERDAEVERLTRSAQSWEAEALRYAQNAGHHEKREAESRRLLERALPVLAYYWETLRHAGEDTGLIDEIRAHLAGGEPTLTCDCPCHPEPVEKIGDSPFCPECRFGCVAAPQARADAAEAALRERDAEIEKMHSRKDAAYLERNKVVAALAKCFPSGRTRTNIEGWSDDWHGCVYIDLPTGQVSWHYHDSHAPLFADLPAYTKPWDGHDTNEKYRRLALLTRDAEVERLTREVAYANDAAEKGEAGRMLGTALEGCMDDLAESRRLLRETVAYVHGAGSSYAHNGLDSWAKQAHDLMERINAHLAEGERSVPVCESCHEAGHTWEVCRG